MQRKQAEIVTECVKGWSPCKAKLRAQYQPGPERAANLRALAVELDLPPEVGNRMEQCLQGSDEQCARVAAIIGAVAACEAATAGACPPCCNAVAGPVVAVLWPIIGPTLTDIAEGFTSLVSVGLEALGLKHEPDFGDDVYRPMFAEANRRWAKLVTEWRAAYPGCETVLEQELARSWAELGAHGFTTNIWLPAGNWGTVETPDELAPFGARWKLEWSKAWQRDDALSAGARALADLYAIRFHAGTQAMARATGRIEGARAFILERITFRPRPEPRPARALAAVAASTTGCAIVVGTWLFALRGTP